MTSWPKHVCPLCGGLNACALVGNENPETPCWCREVIVDPAAIARMPEKLRNKICICRHCAAASYPYLTNCTEEEVSIPDLPLQALNLP